MTKVLLSQHTEASIEDYRRHFRFRAEEIGKEKHRRLVSHRQTLMSLLHTVTHQIGHLTAVYELNVDKHMYLDYCLVRVHDYRLGSNRVEGETDGRFLEVLSSFGNRPRFPGCRFRASCCGEMRHWRGGWRLLSSKGDYGDSIRWRDNAVGVVYGHATSTQDDDQVEVRVGVFGEMASIIQRIKERFGLDGQEQRA